MQQTTQQQNARLAAALAEALAYRAILARLHTRRAPTVQATRSYLWIVTAK